MDKFNAQVRMEFYCSCGGKLEVELTDETDEAYALASVAPCGRCWQEAYQEGLEEGQEAGYSKRDEEMKDGDA